jgi:threonine synthase
MDVGNPSNFERMLWLYNGDLEAVRKDVTGSVHDDVEVKATIRDVFDRTGYVLDPHSAIGYLGVRRTKGIFLATAHPAKFSEIVEPVIGKAIERPEPLAKALEKPRKVRRLDATLAAVKDVVVS